MKNLILFIFLSVVALMSCDSTRGAAETSDNFERPNDIENPDQAMTLATHLSTVPGVQVNGDGPNARIRVRGVSSFNSGNEPLFVVNGQPLSGGYSAAYQAVPTNEIKSIKVLKNPGEISIYGVRGANGVIEITLR